MERRGSAASGSRPAGAAGAPRRDRRRRAGPHPAGRTPKSAAVKAKVGTKIPLGARVIVGNGAKATLRLMRPASVPKTRDLVYVRPAPGTKHASTLTRDAKGILVKIAPS